jgi:hypothetical protein
MLPRIYTYKITFEGTPYWYWGVHKEDEFDEIYWGSPVTNKWYWEVYSPEKQILEIFPYSDEGWDVAQLIEQRLILPDLDNPFCLNERCGVRSSMRVLRENGRRNVATINAEKDDLGRSIQGVKNAERLNAEKDELGRSVNAVKGSIKTNEEKTADGKSVNAVKGAAVLHTFLHSDKNEEGKSKVAVKAGSSTGAQRWRCLVSGVVSNAAGVVRYQRKHNIDTSLRERIL